MKSRKEGSSLEGYLGRRPRQYLSAMPALVTARRPPLRAWALGVFMSLSCLLAIACKPTQIIVVVEADDAVAQEVSQVTAKIYRTDAEDGATPFWEKDVHMSPPGSGDGQVEFPFSFGIVKGKSERFLLVIEGYTSGRHDAVIEQKAIVSFHSGRAMWVKMFLSFACYDLKDPCSGLYQTCKEEVCGPVEEAVSTPFRQPTALDAGPVPADAAVPGDASDAGTVEQDAATAMAGEECDESQKAARACDHHASGTVLKCINDVWEAIETCSETERCDPGAGPDQGTCVPIRVLCQRKLRVEDDVCDQPD